MKIIITEYNGNWPEMFRNEKTRISGLIGHLNPAIEHIGSTSVPGLPAKPLIDILVGMADMHQLNETIIPMNSAYTYIRLYEPDWPERRLYCYLTSESRDVPSLIDVGELSPGEQGFTSLVNIHTVIKDSDDWLRHIAFRDYLRANPETRDEYGRLKLDISKREYKNVMAYNDEKNDFIKKVEKMAKDWYLQKQK